jgi:DNA-directed RNA polymerase subunit N (RpoN/RPB10)
MIVDSMTHAEVYDELAKEREACRGEILTDEEMYKQAKIYYKYEGIIQS